MKSVFLISTASQAFFLSLTPELVENSILILTVKGDKEANNILEYIGSLRWGKIIKWYIPKNNDRSEYLKFLSLRLQLLRFRYAFRHVEKIYFGSYINQYHRGFLAEYEKKVKLFLLYDGLQIISTAHTRAESIAPKEKYPLLMRLLGFKPPMLRTLSYISPISLDIPDRDSLYLIKSSQTQNHKFYDPDLIYFIGQPISSVGVLKSEFYLKTLMKLRGTYKNKTIIYIPHPREKKELLESIGKIVEVRKLDTIFEKYFLDCNRFPQRVFSFYSSVLLNLVFLNAKSKITSLKIPESERDLNNFAGKVEPIYQYFKNIEARNFNVVDIKDIKP